MSVYRIYVEKKEQFAVEAKSVLADLHTSLRMENLKNVRIANRYDVEGIEKDVFESAAKTIFSEPQVDDIYFELPSLKENEKVFAIEYLPGQFDQRADSAAQCIMLMNQSDRPNVKNARVYFLEGSISQAEFESIKEYLINPVESREASLDTVNSLEMSYDIKTTVETMDGFIDLDEDGLKEFLNHYGLAMDLDDLKFLQNYFKADEKRNPTITEIKMIDTYWSDHCRHTTFSTNIDNVKFDTEHNAYIKKTYDEYMNAREVLYKGRSDKPVTLMDLAVIGAKKLKKDGVLTDMDESEEINACSVKIKVDIDGNQEDWLLMFKNETHNHPTEIEPFGGAATCLGGAIRDPLSGRAYVYQAMRVTGAANPLVSLEDTIKGKLPQKKIVTGAAAGYSSYGNQIGLATGQVTEVYHDGYAAKRMEIGAVLGATPIENVVREVPQAGDLVILLGGKTGRDGCGGATGSSKSHNLNSLETCGAEVQKGNPPEERKIQRLFRNKEVTTLIKRCNDFGAGGVSVAIGELADGLHINLDVVPKKYKGLDGTELAISESQERMACVVAKENADKFIKLAEKENLQATLVAEVTDTNRLTMDWEGNRIVDLSRTFLNSNGATKHTDIEVETARVNPVHNKALTQQDIIDHISDLNICSQKGLSERFDSTIGAGTVLMPFGGEYQMTPTQAMVAKIPVLHGETNTCSVMAYGMNPYISEQSPYHGAVYAVIESLAKVVAVGGSAKHAWLTFQEYFERTNGDPKRWGQPLSALLGAYKAQVEMGVAAIGGKDSMSGTFEHIDVPPTLCSFAVSTTEADKAVSQEFKRHSDYIYMILPKYDENNLPDFDSIKNVFDKVEALINNGKVKASWTLGFGGLVEALFKMSLGNRIGVKLTEKIDNELMFNPVYGGFVLETSEKIEDEEFKNIGTTISKNMLILNNEVMIDLGALTKKYEEKLSPVFPYRVEGSNGQPEQVTYKNGGILSFSKKNRLSASIKVAKPKVLIPVFPGTNCEYDSMRAFQKAGAEADVFVIRNLKGSQIEESVNVFAEKIRNSQMIMIPGGFSGGDEPDGSAKFITAFFRNPKITNEVNELLKNRDGLMLGICNGFQALIKLGLVPYGEIRDTTENDPTLTFNTIGRHQSMMVNTRISSNKSPWLYNTNTGDIHAIAISHGEGRFICSKEMFNSLAKNGQIATQYVDLSGQPTYESAFNPNNSFMAVEGITSPDGRVFGKMGHSERTGENICKNILGNKDQMLFKSGVEYFTK